MSCSPYWILDRISSPGLGGSPVDSRVYFDDQVRRLVLGDVDVLDARLGARGAGTEFAKNIRGHCCESNEVADNVIVLVKSGGYLRSDAGIIQYRWTQLRAMT